MQSFTHACVCIFASTLRLWTAPEHGELAFFTECHEKPRRLQSAHTLQSAVRFVQLTNRSSCVFSPFKTSSIAVCYFNIEAFLNVLPYIALCVSLWYWHLKLLCHCRVTVPLLLVLCLQKLWISFGASKDVTFNAITSRMRCDPGHRPDAVARSAGCSGRRSEPQPPHPFPSTTVRLYPTCCHQKVSPGDLILKQKPLSSHLSKPCRLVEKTYEDWRSAANSGFLHFSYVYVSVARSRHTSSTDVILYFLISMAVR
jgi:hypothetical protein